MLIIDENFKIEMKDNLNYELYEKRDVVSKKTQEKKKDWVRVGYYGKLSHALHGVLERMVGRTVTQENLSCARLYERLNKMEETIFNSEGKKK